MDVLAELWELAPPQGRPPAPDPGASPRALPPDFLQLAIQWGPGRFGGFLWLLVPGAENRDLALEVQANRQLRALRDLEAGGEPVPYEIDRLLPWAISDNGDVAYWRVDGEPGEWTVAINESRGPEWHEFAGGAAEFVLAWLTGHERVPVFPDDVPDPRDPFTAWTPADLRR